ncbi:hypothetical protein [Leucobacter luti]|uniref:hypothetical protein n=1 Tax=Leucobacter luti TaxID=340320 RepID=UPI003D06383A
MSIAHLSPAAGRRRSERVAGAAAVGSPAPGADPERDRLLALVTQIDGDRLELAEEMLGEILAHQRADARRMTAPEMSALARLGVAEEALMEPSALPATMRGKLWEREMAARTHTVAEVAEMLGVTAARVRQRCAAGTLIAHRRSDGWALPAFQFPEGRELPGWGQVARVIGAGTPLLLAERVLTSPAPRLTAGDEALAPFEWLAQGGDPEAAAAAVDDALNRLP